MPKPVELPWEQRDRYDNGRVFYVDEPDDEGDISIGIAGVYNKHLTPAEAKQAAAALLRAVELAKERKAKRKASPYEAGPVLHTSGCTGVITPIAWAGRPA